MKSVTELKCLSTIPFNSYLLPPLPPTMDASTIKVCVCLQLQSNTRTPTHHETASLILRSGWIQSGSRPGSEQGTDLWLLVLPPSSSHVRTMYMYITLLLIFGTRVFLKLDNPTFQSPHGFLLLPCLYMYKRRILGSQVSTHTNYMYPHSIYCPPILVYPPLFFHPIYCPLTINAHESLHLALVGGLVLTNQLRAVLRTRILHTCITSFTLVMTSSIYMYMFVSSCFVLCVCVCVCVCVRVIQAHYLAPVEEIFANLRA